MVILIATAIKQNVFKGGSVMFMSLASNIDNTTLDKIRKLEKEIGYPLLAFSFFDIEPASLDEKKLEKIRKFEEGTCICLLAVAS